MKIVAIIAITIFAMSSTSFASTCGARFTTGGNSLLKSTAATSSNIAATVKTAQTNTNATAR